jgi:hypothetical protein
MRHAARVITFGVLFVAGALLAVAAEMPGPPGKLYAMEVMGVAPDPATGIPLLFLRGKEDKRELSMFIAPLEAQAIAAPLQGFRPPRPQTHDLALSVIHRLKARVKRALITELKDQTFFAHLILDVEGQEIVLDSRPSDAIALALREEAPIYAAEQVFQRHGPDQPPEQKP